MATIKEIKQSLDPLFKIGLTPWILGPHGVGKSAAIRQYTQEKGIGFVDMRLGNYDLGDLLGLPMEATCPITGDVITKFARPEWFPIEGEGVLFLDELNLAPKHILNACFQLILDRQVGGRKLPDGWKIVAAGNPPTGDYDVTSINSKALLDRFCIIMTDNSVNEFLGYAKDKKMSSSMIDFLTSNPEHASSKTENFNLDEYVSPSHRTWEFVSRLDDLEMEDNVRRIIMRGMLGFTTTVAYMDFKEKNQLNISVEDLLNKYKTVKPKIDKLLDKDNPRLDHLNSLADKVFDYIKDNKLKTKQAENIITFLNELPKDITVKFILSASEGSRDLTSQLWKNFSFIESNDTKKTLRDMIRESVNLVNKADKKE